MEESVLSSSDTLCFVACRRLFDSSASATHTHTDTPSYLNAVRIYIKKGQYIEKQVHELLFIKIPVFCRAACCVYCSAVCSSDFSDTNIPMV